MNPGPSSTKAGSPICWSGNENCSSNSTWTRMKRAVRRQTPKKFGKPHESIQPPWPQGCGGFFWRRWIAQAALLCRANEKSPNISATIFLLDEQGHYGYL